jgi:hypothetical protein
MKIREIPPRSVQPQSTFRLRKSGVATKGIPAPKALRKKSLAEKRLSAFRFDLAGKKLTSQGRCCGVGVSVLNVVDDWREQQHSASAEECREYDGCHPVSSTRCPGEWEETGGKEECSDEGGWKSQLRRDLSVGLVVSRTPPVPRRISLARCHSSGGLSFKLTCAKEHNRQRRQRIRPVALRMEVER